MYQIKIKETNKKFSFSIILLFVISINLIIKFTNCNNSNKNNDSDALKFLEIKSLSPSSSTIPPSSEEEEITHCIKIGGNVKKMTVQIDTHGGIINGLEKYFCFYETKSHNLAIFGLEALGSKKPNIAATYIKSIKLVNKVDIPGPYGNTNMNLCHQLRGAMITFLASGGFDKKGQSDMCFFGDGSSISAWTLFYLGVGDIFQELKSQVKSEPLLIDIPDVYQ
jgi:hypothetical protein